MTSGNPQDVLLRIVDEFVQDPGPDDAKLFAAIVLGMEIQNVDPDLAKRMRGDTFRSAKAANLIGRMDQWLARLRDAANQEPASDD